MLESAFILSLGITFILIMFLVYHFKQRLTILENRCDTTFELINSVVSELGAIRSYSHVDTDPMHSTCISHSMTNNHNEPARDDADDDDDDDDADDDDDDDADDDDDDADDDDDEYEDMDSDDENANHKDNNGIQVDTANVVRVVNIDNLPDLNINDIVDSLDMDNNNDNVIDI